MPSPTSPPQGGYFHHELSDFHYRMSLDDGGRMWMKQYELDAAGDIINDVDLEAHFSVGSGNHARTYLHQTTSGELWELPVTWYTKNGWNMSPGFDATEHSNFSRKITRECMFCHNAYPDVPLAGSDTFLAMADVFPTSAASMELGASDAMVPEPIMSASRIPLKRPTKQYGNPF